MQNQIIFSVNYRRLDFVWFSSALQVKRASSLSRIIRGILHFPHVFPHEICRPGASKVSPYLLPLGSANSPGCISGEIQKGATPVDGRSVRKRAHLCGHVRPLAHEPRVDRVFGLNGVFSSALPPARARVHLACRGYFTLVSHWMKNARGPVRRAFRIFQSAPAHSYRHLIRCVQAAASTPIFVYCCTVYCFFVVVFFLSISPFFFTPGFFFSVGQNYHRNRRVYERNRIAQSQRRDEHFPLSLFVIFFSSGSKENNN